MSADTGYSKFVMYRRSDLMQYSDVAHLYQTQREDGESKGEGKDECK
jgi:hypothetical protein